MTEKTIKWTHPAFLIATWFGIGKIPFAPGTWGSLFTFPLFIAAHYLLAFASSESGFIYLFLGFVAALFIIGTYATNIYMKHTGKHDPKEVVIDEVAGQILVFFAAFVVIAEHLKIFEMFYGTDDIPHPPVGIGEITSLLTNPEFIATYIVVGLPIYLVCFALFRLFDIWKPWPIRSCDKNIKGGFGVMFDDLFAAMYAVIVLYGLGMLISM